MARQKQALGGSLREGAATASGGIKLTFGLFGLIVAGLFLMIVAGSCAEVGVEYGLGADDLFERIAGPVLCLLCVIVGAGLAATPLSVVTTFVAAGYKAVISRERAGARQKAGLLALTGLGTLAGALGIGGWRLSAGYAAGEPGWVMQGTVIAAVGGVVGLLLLPAAAVLSVRGGEPARRSGSLGNGALRDGARGDAARAGAKEGDAAWIFTFLAVLGIVFSIGVVEYVGLARQLAGRGPMPLGDYVDLGGRPAELTMPPGLDGPHAIVVVGSVCPYEIVDDDGDAVRVKHEPKEVDADGDTERLARLTFRADSRRRYRVRFGAPESPCEDDDVACRQRAREAREKCPYSVRLVREP